MRPVLVFYDWLINLDEEIHYFWDFRKGRKLTAAAVIYGMTRYPLIVMSILELQTSFPMSETVCAQCVSRVLWKVTDVSLIRRACFIFLITIFALTV